MRLLLNRKTKFEKYTALESINSSLCYGIIINVKIQQWMLFCFLLGECGRNSRLEVQYMRISHINTDSTTKTVSIQINNFKIIK